MGQRNLHAVASFAIAHHRESARVLAAPGYAEDTRLPNQPHLSFHFEAQSQAVRLEKGAKTMLDPGIQPGESAGTGCKTICFDAHLLQQTDK